MVVINTCAFIRPAVEESIEEILEACKKKEGGRVEKVFVVGCLVERYGERELKRVLPEVDGFYGVIKEPKKAALKLIGPSEGEERVVTTYPFAYVKIGEGCSRRCSFCLIPRIRGRARSRRIGEIVREVEGFSEEVKEVILVAQDTSYFGRDTGESLSDLIKALGRVGRYRWLRVLYIHPSGVDERLVEAFFENDRAVPYFDIPMQHSSDKILSLMKRGYRRRHLERVYRLLRESFPDGVLRTTVMVGFPGEGKREFEELLSFLRDHPFEYLGAFPYYDEEGASSRKLKGKVGKKAKEKRLEAVYDMQYEITYRLLKRFVGRRLPVLFEGDFGRFYGQAPEIDGVVRASGRVGEIREVEVKGVDGYDLIA